MLRGFESGADDYLAKPFELPILIARVQGLLRRREWFRLGRDRESPGEGLSESERAAVRIEVNAQRLPTDGRDNAPRLVTIGNS